MKEKGNNKITFLVIGILAGLILGGLGGYFISNHFHRNNFSGRNFQLDQNMINNINSFFNGSPTQEQITSYCQQNMSSCFYYCRQNPAFSYCSQLNIPSQRGTPQTG